MKKAAVTHSSAAIPALPAKPLGATGSPAIAVPAKKHLVVETLSVQLDVSPSGNKLEAFVNYICAGKTSPYLSR